MRTTLELEDDILQAAKELAAQERTTVGKIISKLARKGLRVSKSGAPLKIRNGVPVFASRGEVITLDHLQRLMDEEGGLI
jgi:predicted DNA-binding ribbon-helix-helix protein